MTESHPDSTNDQKGPFLYDLEPNHRFVGFYMVKEKQLEPFRDRSKGHFLSLTLADRSGDMLARVWENAEETLTELGDAPVIKIDGETEEYHDRIQVRIYRVRPANETEYQLDEFLPRTDKDIHVLTDQLIAFIEKVNHPELKALLAAFFHDEEFLLAFQTSPAAMHIHHAYLGGLLEHTVECLITAETIFKLYPGINADLLYSGLILHDIGKIREFNFSEGISYSNEGRLVGHIAMTYQMISEAAAKIEGFSPELAMELEHIVLSHHGRYEWGSPRRPKTLEAAAVHYIDNLTAQLNRFSRHTKSTKDGWSPYDRSLNRSIYTSGMSGLNIEETSQLEG